MYVRGAAKVSDQCGPFQTPDIPDAVIVEIARLVERDMDFVHSAACIDDLHRFVNVFFAIGKHDVLEHGADELLLIIRQISTGDARQRAACLANRYCTLRRSFLQQRFSTLLCIERFEDFVGSLGLIREEVVIAVTRFGVTVDDRSTERDTFERVSIGAEV